MIGLLDVPGCIPREYVQHMLDQLKRNNLIPGDIMTSLMWTAERRVEALLRLPWTISVDQNLVDGSWVVRVAEIPSALAVVKSLAEIEDALWASLGESLRVIVEFGDPIRLPPGVERLPWEAPEVGDRKSVV